MQAAGGGGTYVQVCETTGVPVQPDGVEDDTVLFDDEQGRPRRVPLALVARARLEVEF